jgi:Mrp family chromosome partitioning ATPase
MLQAVTAGRSVVSRPDRPTAAPRLPLLQPVCYKEGDAESNGEQTENRVIVITSGKGGVGKTTASANLGMSIAR